MNEYSLLFHAKNDENSCLPQSSVANTSAMTAPYWFTSSLLPLTDGLEWPEATVIDAVSLY